MKTSVIEVHDLLSVLSLDEVEKRIGEVPGVESVTANFAAGNATVRYDETRLDISHLKSIVRQRSFDHTAPAPAPTNDGHKDHGAPSTSPAPVAQKSTPVPPVTAGVKPPDKVEPPATPSASPTTISAAPEATALKPKRDAGPAGDEQKDRAAPKQS